VVDLGGGGIAAYGLRYQYLVTAEYVLAFLRDNPDRIPHATLVIEPLHKKADGGDDDIVDFAIEVYSEPSHNAQVKSSSEPDTHPLQPAAARDVFSRLVDHPAERRLLLTNKPLSPDLGDAVTELEGNGFQKMYTWSDGPRLEGGEDSAQPRIVLDARNPVDLRNSIAELIKVFRVQRGRSPGVVSCRLLVSILVDYIFAAAAGTEPGRISAIDLLEKLAMPDATIAQVAGGFDWGLPISNIPNYMSTVPRIGYLEDVREHLAVAAEPAASPARVVLTGRTGNGKTVLASDYCHVEAISYAFICWIDCREVDFIEPQVRNFIAQLTNEAIAPDAAVGPIFAAILGRHSGPWLLVFDGIQNRADIEEYIPSRGLGSVLVTTNNSLNWWPTANVIEVGELGEDEAIICFASYAGVASAEHAEVRSSILDIVNQLGRIPLAVSMSAIYFKNAEGQLDELAPRYFKDLAALADDAAKPPGFPKTAFAAIQYASRNLGKGTPAADLYGRSARAVLEIGCLLAPELLPLNFILQATADSVNVDLARLPVPSEVELVVQRGVLSTLRTQSIARRVVNDGEGNRTPVSETVAIHPLVHDILQRSYLAAAPKGVIESQCTVFMYFFIGWIGKVRDQGEYFAVEQLRLHANALLSLIDGNQPMSSLSPQHHRVFTYAKALLQGELSTCSASQGKLQEALDLGRGAAQSLAPFLSEKPARFIRMKILANMVADLSIGEAPPEVTLSLVVPLVAAAKEAESDTAESTRSFAYTVAGDALTYLNRIELYRESPLLADSIAELEAITGRDPHPETQAAKQNSMANRLYEARKFQELLEHVIRWRESNSSIENAVVLDAMKVVCQLHTDEVDEALRGIDTLVEMTTHGNYLLLSMHEALKKIGRELHRVMPDLPDDQVRLQSALDRVLTRYNELSDFAGAPSADD
jgi:hypothetical protein